MKNNKILKTFFSKSQKTNLKLSPEISVILPFYNAEKTLGKAIESILNQTFSDFELILVNNNSNDKSIEKARDFAKRNSRIILLSEEKQGVAFAMNCGLQHARGKFLARMDADDIAVLTKLEKQYHYLKENPEIDFVGSEVKYVSKEKNTDGFQRFIKWINSFHFPCEIEMNRFVEIPIVNPTIFFKREVYEKFGGCRHGDFPEDYEMQLRYLQAGVKMAKLPEKLLEWHDSPTRITRTHKRYSTEAFLKTKAKYFKTWSEKNNRFHPIIWIWGAGRKTRQRAKLLEKEGLKIEGYFDVVKTNSSIKNIFHYSEIPEPGSIFIVQMVNKIAAREQIRKYLINAKYIEGIDFILMG